MKIFTLTTFNFNRFVTSLLLLTILLFSSVTDCLAQPSVLFTGLTNTTPAPSNLRFTLNTVGGFRQVRFQSNQSVGASTTGWAFHTGTTGAPNYSPNWRPFTSNNTLSSNVFIPTSFSNGAKYNSSGGGADGLLPAITSGNYYTFNVSANATADNVMQLLETSYNPVSISTVTQSVGANGTRTISITTSGTPNASENIFVRYSTNSFVSSTIVQANGSGTTWTATIPLQTTTVNFYVYTSPKTKTQIDNDVTAYGQAVHDMSTLNLNNNSGANYSYGPISVTSTGGTSTSATYATLAAAITAINGGTIHTGTIVCSVNAGYAETAPAGGFSITATGTAANTITFQKVGTGTNPTFTAPLWAAGGLTDAIFKIIGGDYITIDGFTIQENSGNTVTATGATNTMTEVGIGMYLTTATNGAQNNTIQNCTISLSSVFPNTVGIFSSSSSSSTNGALAASATTGTNSNNKIYGNTINNVAYGIYIISEPITSTINESGWDIGGTSSATGNTINFGNATTSTIGWTRFAATSIGAVVLRNGVGANIRFNTITSNSLAYPQSNFGGVLISSGAAPSGVTYTSTISNNNITLTNTGSTQITAVDFGHGIATGTMAGSNNTIVVNQTAGIATSAAVRGIIAAYTHGGITLENNTITINQTNSVGATSSAVTAINAAGASANSITTNVNSNSIAIRQNAPTGTGSYTTGTITYISVAAVQGIVNVNSNQLLTTGSTIRSTGDLFAINHSATIQSLTVNLNTITIDRISASGNIYGTYSTTTPSSVAEILTNNNITYTGLTGTTNAYGLSSLDGASATTPKTQTGNTISITGTNTGIVRGIATGYCTGSISNNNITINTNGATVAGIDATSTGNGANTLTNNTISLTSGSTSPTSMVGITAGATGPFQIHANTFTTMTFNGVFTSSPVVSGIAISAGTGNNIYNNVVRNISVGTSSGASNPVVDGILISGGTSTNVYTNKIFNIASLGTGATGVVNGLRITGGTTNTVYNNTFGGLTASNSTNPDGVRGISITSTTASTTQNIFHNTVLLNATSSGANFGTTGIFHTTSTISTTSALNLRNNIIINNSTPVGTGRSVAYRRSTTTLTNYASTSDNNLFYAGIPGANNVIFSDGTNNDQTLADFKTRMSTRDQASQTENTTFISTTGSDADFLRIAAGTTSFAESSAVLITSPITVNSDYWNITRPFPSPTNGGTAPDMGASEFDGIAALVNCTTPGDQATAFTPGTLTSTSIAGSFTAASSNPTGYLVVRSPGALSATPVDGTIYGVGATLGNGTVIQSGNSVSFSATGLTSNTAYTITVYSFNSGSCSGGPKYLTTSPLTGVLTTCPAAPTTFVNSAITSSSATISWTASAVGGSAATINYILEVYTDSGYTTPISGSPFAVGSAVTYGLTGLSASTTYYYRAKANNGSCDSAYLSSGVVTTACLAETAPTVIQTFATFTGSAPNPVCWSEATGAVAAPSTLSFVNSEWLNSTGFANTGTNVGAKTNLYSTNTGEWLISNQIDLGSTPSLYRLRYDMAVTSYNGTAVQSTLGTHIVRVIISTDGGTTWTSANTLKTYTGAGTYSNTGQTEYINLTGYSGIIKIAFVATTSSLTPDIDFHIDNFGVELLPACSDAPASIASTTNITTNTATINWTAAATTPGNAYEYYYSTSNTAPNSGTTPSGSVGPTTLTANITGLTASTTYYVWVRSDCDGTNKSSWTGSGTFVTACTAPNNPSTPVFSAISTTGLTLNFTAASPTPTAYVVFRSTSNVPPTPVNGTVYNSGTSYTFSAVSYTCVANGTSTTVTQTGLTGNTNYYYYIFSRDNTNSCFGAPWYSTGISANQITCPAAPTAFVNSSISSSGATVSWTASAGGIDATINYILEVYTDAGFTTPIAGSPFAVGTGVSYTLTGLSASTTYYYRAKANNGICDSAYLSGGTFSTTCNAIASFPSVEPFATYLPTVCWNEGDLGNLTTGPATIGGSTTSDWVEDGFLNVGTTGCAKMNIDAATGSEWLLTPFYAIPAAGYRIKYNVGATQWNATTAPTTAWEADDFVEVLVSLDNTNWTVLKTYNNTSVPSHLGQLDFVDISSYGGQTVRFAFRAFEGTSNGSADIDFFVDNFTVELIPDPITVNASAGTTICNGDSTELTASSATAYTYTWSPAIGLNTTNGAVVTANPSVTTTYTVTGTFGAVVNTQTVTITVNPSPANVVLTPSSTTVCSDTTTLLSASSLLNNTITVGTSSGTSVAGTTPYRQAVTTQARMQYLITKAELNALGINTAANLTSLGFNVTSTGSGTIPTYTISMANTNATVLTSAFLNPTFTTVYTTSNYVVTLGVNTHTFTTPFAWDGNSNIVVNICMAGLTSGTSATVNVSTQAVTSTATLSGASSCSTGTANNTSVNRPVMFIGTSVNNAITWAPFTGLYTDSGATTAYAGEVLSAVYAKPSVTTTYTATATLGSCTKTASTTLTVDAAPVAGTVSSNQALCSGSTPADITLTGSSGAIQWESSSNNTTFNAISGATNSTLLGSTIGALTSTQYYRAVVSNGVCTSAISPVVTVAVSTPVDFANLQFPSSGAICAGNSFTAYGQVYEPGVTEAAGAGSGITVEFGYHTANTDPSTWTNWSAATFNSQQGNNDEYLYIFTPSTGGTYFYTFRYKQGACDWQYGGFNGGFWNGTSNVNGTLTVSEQPTTAAAGGDQTVCEGITINLSANSPTVGTGSWSVISGVGGSFASVSNPTTTFTGNANTVYTLQWTISNGSCTASTDEVTITIQRGILDYYNLQTSAATICEGSTFDAYGQVYESGVTEAVGSGNGIEVEFGYHTSNTNPNTWTTWSASGVAYFGQSGIGNNNDEFKVTTGAALTFGTYYYTFRYRINGCDWYYGGYSATGGGAWDGSSNISGVLTVNALPTAAITANSGANSCSGSNVSFTISGTADAVVTYNLNGGTNTTATLVGGTTVITVNGATSTQTLNLVSVAKNGCTVTVGTSSTVTITTVVWDGTAWSNTTGPIGTDSALISGNYTSSTNGGNITACSLKVTNNAVVIISSNNTVNLNGALTVDAGSSFTLENNANLIQTGTTNTNSGAITVKRNSSLLKRLDYTLWSSPVANQNLLSFSPQTLTNRFYTYNSTTNLYAAVDPSTSSFAAANGYLIRTPNNHPSITPTSWLGQFTGVPNNGNYAVTMQDDVAGQRFNLVGNPYPSPIDALAFVDDAINANSITGTLYFWRKTNNTASPSYCTWTTAGFVTNNEAQVFDPNDVIQTGQGFFVEATGTNDQLVFNNAMRVDDHANQFFRNNQTTNTVERNRIWLNATNNTGSFSQAMVGYITNATNGFDARIDGKYINDGDIALTSLLGGEPMTIQGRALPFDVADVVPMRFVVTTAGNYTIAIDHVDGLFATGQNVYLRDNVMGTTHNLTEGAYSFASEAGTFDARFEVVFQSTLGTDEPTLQANQVVIYPLGTNAIVINTGNSIMSAVKIFDIRGRLLSESKDINASQTTMNVSLSNEVILVQITDDNGTTVTKKFIK